MLQIHPVAIITIATTMGLVTITNLQNLQSPKIKQAITKEVTAKEVITMAVVITNSYCQSPRSLTFKVAVIKELVTRQNHQVRRTVVVPRAGGASSMEQVPYFKRQNLQNPTIVELVVTV